MTTSHGHGLAADDRDVKFARSTAGLFGLVFLVVGIAGFIPGLTTNYDELAAAGHQSDAKLLGIFEVSVLHNLVHLAFGAAGLILSREAFKAAYYLLGGGVLYAVVWLYGLVVDHDSSANFLPLNDADNWLHLVLAVAMIGLGALALKKLRDHGRTAGRRDV